ncbi:MAG TPA: DNA recombination/repair protein RecA, partial [Geobacteraceae bacterium]|nr:DNA recombination/repair protein RecA [Geobacteraceae bacterium]
KGVVDKSGAWFSFDKERIGQGRENSRIYLKDNPAVAGQIKEKLLAALSLAQTQAAVGRA